MGRHVHRSLGRALERALMRACWISSAFDAAFIIYVRHH